AIPGIRTGSIFSDPSVAASAADSTHPGGRLYFAAAQGDGSSDIHHPVVSTSIDHGATWTTALDLSVASVNVSGDAVGVQSIAFPTTIAGDLDRGAVAFLGTKTPNNAFGNGFPGFWHLYVAITYDGGAHWTSYDATPSTNVQGGCISLGGTLGAACADRN